MSLLSNYQSQKNYREINLMKVLTKKLHSDDHGSASVEFVLLAIPLFLPILLFLGHFERLSNSELVAQTLVRESLRAYVTSPNTWSAVSRANQTLRSAALIEGLSEVEINNLKLDFQCSEFPCLTPGGKIRAILKLNLPQQGSSVVAEAEEFVSPWQWTGTSTD